MLQRGTRANIPEYVDARKAAKAICHRKKKEYEENIFISIKIDTLEIKYENFTKGCTILREVFNQESQYVGIRLGI
jgi:hypothetical protein